MGLAHARLGLVLLALLVTSGCSGANPFRPTSRWAMDDPEYAAKYDKPYPSNVFEKSRRIAKQMSDARHVEGDTGFHLKGAYSNNPDAGMVELGIFGYLAAWFEAHGGVSLLLGEDDILGFPGIDVGVRAQAPSRLAPFVGAGVYTDISDAIFGGDDCDCDSSPRYRDNFAAVYPEVGVHYWLDGSTRMTLSAGYYFNSNGRDQDFWMFGLTFAGFSRDRSPPPTVRWSPPQESYSDRENLVFDSPQPVSLNKRKESISLEQYLQQNYGTPSTYRDPAFDAFALPQDVLDPEPPGEGRLRR